MRKEIKAISDHEKAKKAAELVRLRDEFAMAAMQGLLSDDCEWNEEDVAKYAYIQADAMLEARK